LADGFDLTELMEYTKTLENTSNNMKQGTSAKKFLGKEGNKLNKLNKSTYKSKGIGEVTGNLVKGFKRGKVYKYEGAWSVRAMNTSPHAHLLDKGWIHKASNGNEKFIPGFNFMEDAKQSFESGYYEDVEEFLEEIIEKGL
jgi:hypothetical protein